MIWTVEALKVHGMYSMALASVLQGIVGCSKRGFGRLPDQRSDHEGASMCDMMYQRISIRVELIERYPKCRSVFQYRYA